MPIINAQLIPKPNVKPKGKNGAAALTEQTAGALTPLLNVPLTRKQIVLRKEESGAFPAAA